MDDPALQEAVRELLVANEGFRRAYEAWTRAPDREVSWERRILVEAAGRLDAARDRIDEVEFGRRRAPPRSR